MLILAAILTILVYGLTAPMLGALLPSFKLTGGEAGTLGLMQALGLVIASLSAGPVIDRQGKKIALLVGLGLVSIALFGMPSAGGYNTLLGLFLMFGIGGGIVVTGANALASDVDENRRGATLNFLNLFFGLGGIITPFISGIVAPDQLCYAVATLSALVFLFVLMTQMARPSGVAAFKMSEAFALLTKPQLILLSLFLFLYVACEVGVWNWLKVYLVSPAIGLDARTASNIIGFGFALGILVGRLLTARILLKLAPITVTLFASILMAITTYAMLNSTNATTVTIIVFCAGLAMAPMFPTALAMVADAFRRGTASAMGIAITFGWIGLAVSSPIIGQVSGASNDNLRTALLLLPALSILMVLVSLALRPLLRRPATV